jgi:LPXTG-motif cell wall-anchored protein
MISNTLAWMSGEMWFLAGGLLVILAGLIILVDRKTRKRWERGRNRPVP